MDYQKIAKNLKKNYDEKVIRTLKEIGNKFKDKEEVKKILKKENPVLYKVFIKEINENEMMGLTILNSGDISDEFYMTKGHRHKKPISEKYILIKGNGKLILQNKLFKVVKLKKNKVVNVPGKFAHRLVNVGKGKLEVLAFYNKNAGHDYKTIFKKRLLKNG